MRYWLDLFTPETWEAFRAHGGQVSGFREKQLRTAQHVEPGDMFLCYLVRLSRWCGLLKVTSSSYIDATPIFRTPDPFTVRFRVEPLVALGLEVSIPIFEGEVWSRLSFTRNLEVRAPGWAQPANLRASLRELSYEDGSFLEDILGRQGVEQKLYPLTETDRRRLKQTVRTPDRVVVVDVPADPEGTEEAVAEAIASDRAVRESFQMQAFLARIAAEMGFRIWIPRSDKQRISQLLPENLRASLISDLPLNYDDLTLSYNRADRRHLVEEPLYRESV